ncbi:MAG TPA: nitroreductase family protein [Clostridia bacterium]|nr:nitroreductase family protein [Clostridia bacterium]
MEFFELVKQRQSCRSYDKNKRVNNEDLQKILEAGLIAPSAKNFQPWKFYVTTGGKTKDLVAEACQAKGMNVCLTDCPVLITVVKEPHRDLPGFALPIKIQDFRPVDIGLSVAQMTLAAKELGLDTLIVGWLNDKKIIEALDLPDDSDICLVLAVGYASQGYETREKNRKPFEEKVVFK